jgi:hypothetical protein
MLQQDIKQMQDPTFIPDASNSVYCIFMIIGIIGYFCVPTVSSWIIQAGGAGAYGQKVGGAGKMAGNGAAAVGADGLGGHDGEVEHALLRGASDGIHGAGEEARLTVTAVGLHDPIGRLRDGVEIFFHFADGGGDIADD